MTDATKNPLPLRGRRPIPSLWRRVVDGYRAILPHGRKGVGGPDAGGQTGGRLMAWFRRSGTGDLELPWRGRSGTLFVPGPELVQVDIEESDLDDWSRQLKVPPAPISTAQD